MVDSDVEGNVELAPADVIAIVAGVLRVQRTLPLPAVSMGSVPVDVELAYTASQRSDKSMCRLRVDLDGGRVSIFAC